MAVFKVTEYVCGTYEYAVPINEDILNDVNKFMINAMSKDNNLITPLTLEELIDIADYNMDNPRFSEEYICTYTCPDGTVRSWSANVGEDVYDYLTEIAWDYPDGDFCPNDTTDVERWVEE